ncbi:MAG TPA: hypothetical protein VFA18_06495, partial [Gemmataceae bacterium]|nr:hypothetical protein [Gemmataceae bacterium]
MPPFFHARFRRGIYPFHVRFAIDRPTEGPLSNLPNRTVRAVLPAGAANASRKRQQQSKMCQEQIRINQGQPVRGRLGPSSAAFKAKGKRQKADSREPFSFALARSRDRPEEEKRYEKM